MKMKRALSRILAISMALSMMYVPANAQSGTYSDIGNHWGEAAIVKWSDLGILEGYENNEFLPDGSVTRGELAVVLDRLMNYQTQAENNYTDLPNEWYTEAILSATAAGVMNGSDGMARPTDKITRQEATTMLARAFGIENVKATANTFSDKAEIGAWAMGAVDAMAERGYVSGDGGAFRPNGFITRAETVKIIDNAVKAFYSVKGTYTQDVTGTVIINAPDVTLKGMKITGDLIIAEGVAAGDVTLDSVTVTGRVLVRGGGVNSFKVMGTSKLQSIVLDKVDGALRIVANDGSVVDTLFVGDGKDDVIVEGKFKDVQVATDTPVNFKNAKVETITATAANVNMTVSESSKVNTIATASANTTINVNGTVDNVAATAQAGGATLNVGKTGNAVNVTTDAPNTTIANNGKVGTLAVANAATNTKIVVGDNSTMTNIVATTKSNITVTTPAAEDAAKALAEATTEEAKAAAEKAVADAKAAADKAAADADKKTQEKPVTPPTVADGGDITVPENKPEPPPSTGGGDNGYYPPSVVTVGTETALIEAIAGNVSTVRLTDNIALTQTITVGRSVTLDLNGKVITLTTPNDTVGSINAFVVNAAGAMTLKDGATGGKIAVNAIETGFSTKPLIECNGTFVMESGTIETNTNVYYALGISGAACKATVNGGTIKSNWNTEGVAIGGNGTKTYEGYTLNVNGGVIDGGEQAMYLPSAGTVNITGGTVSGGKEGIEIRAGVLNISGGEISATAPRATNVSTNNGATGAYTGALVIAKSKNTTATGYNGHINVNVTGGTLTNTNGDAICVVHEANIKGYEVPQHVVVAVTSAATLSGGRNIQEDFGTIEGDEITIADSTATAAAKAALNAAIVAAIEPTNKALEGIAVLSMTGSAATVEFVDPTKTANDVLTNDFMAELFSYADIKNVKIGEAVIDVPANATPEQKHAVSVKIMAAVAAEAELGDVGSTTPISVLHDKEVSVLLTCENTTAGTYSDTYTVKFVDPAQKLHEAIEAAVGTTNEALGEIAELTLNEKAAAVEILKPDTTAFDVYKTNFLAKFFEYAEITTVTVTGDDNTATVVNDVSINDEGTYAKIMAAVANEAGISDATGNTPISELGGKSVTVELQGKTPNGVAYTGTYTVNFTTAQD